jgi:hypothetical protein
LRPAFKEVGSSLKKAIENFFQKNVFRKENFVSLRSRFESGNTIEEGKERKKFFDSLRQGKHATEHLVNYLS